MGLTMRERQAVTKEVSLRYQKATKKQKGIMLNEFIELTGYTRCYASYVLRNHGRQIRVSRAIVIEGDIRKRRKRKRQKYYDEKVFEVLKKIWLIMDCICGKRLAPALKEVVLKLQKHKEIAIDKGTRQKLFKISPATIDRML